MVDLKADNGMIHVVADVLFPIPENDLVDTLIADERYQFLSSDSNLTNLSLPQVLYSGHSRHSRWYCGHSPH